MRNFYSNRHGLAIGDLALTDQHAPEPLIDREFLEQVWSWITAQSSATIGEDDDTSRITLGELKDLEVACPTSSVNEEEATSKKTSKPVQISKPAQIEEERIAAPPKCPRIHVGEERMWKALTGHEKDLKRVPFFEFQLLSHIAFAGPDGIVQPDLVAASGQDKRSVPKRTDNLHAKGYIEKRGVLSNIRTTLLTHKRFTGSAAAKGDPERIFVNGVLDYLKFLDFLLFEKDSYDGGLIPLSDLYKDLVSPLVQHSD